MARAFDIGGFPTLKAFINGVGKSYTGMRDAETIVSWLQEKAVGYKIPLLKTVEAAQKSVDDNEFLVFGFFKDLDSKEASIYQDAANVNDKKVFVWSNTDEVAKHYGIEEDNQILVFASKNGDKPIRFEQDLDAQDLHLFVQAHTLPPIVTYDEANQEQVFDVPVKIHLLFFSSSKDPKHEEYMKIITPVAMDFKGKLIFVWVDSSKPEAEGVYDFLDVKVDEMPEYVIYDLVKNHKFKAKANQVVKADEVTKFAQDFFAGKVERSIKSEDLPKNWDLDPVKKLVGSNFDSIAYYKSKDVLVAIYSNWSSRCKKIHGVMDDLAKKVADKSDLVLAKINGLENEFMDFVVDTYPTIKLFKKDTNEAVDYKGPQQVDDLVKFLETGDQDQEAGDKERAEAEGANQNGAFDLDESAMREALDRVGVLKRDDNDDDEDGEDLTEEEEVQEKSSHEEL